MIVRLKAFNNQRKVLENTSFNSMIVRLKEKHRFNNYSNIYKFQFYDSPIKS